MGAEGDDCSFGGEFTRARVRTHTQTVSASGARDPASACLKDPDFAVTQLDPNKPNIRALV